MKCLMLIKTVLSIFDSPGLVATQVCLNLVTTRKICHSLNITSRGHDIISRPQKLIWRYRELTSRTTAYHHVPTASYVLATEDGPSRAPYICVWAALKKSMF